MSTLKPTIVGQSFTYAGDGVWQGDIDALFRFSDETDNWSDPYTTKEEAVRQSKIYALHLEHGPLRMVKVCATNEDFYIWVSEGQFIQLSDFPLSKESFRIMENAPRHHHREPDLELDVTISEPI